MLKVSDIQNDQTVYVRNRTKSDLSLTIKDDAGTAHLIRVLRASIPQDITEIVTSEQLKKSVSFKKAIAQGYLEILPNDEAENELATDDAKMELAHIKKKLSRMPKELMIDEAQPDKGTSVTPTDAVAGSQEDEEIRSEVKDVAIDEDSSAEDKYARLLFLFKEQPFNRKELDWLLSRIPDNDSSNAKLLGWLAQQKKKLK